MRLIESEAALQELSRDAGIYVLRPSAAFEAENEADVIAVLESARLKRTTVTPRGAGTSIPSQAVGRGIILLQRPNDATTEETTVRCGPSMTKGALNERLDAVGTWLPPDPSSYQSCTVGGMVSNNSSGTRTFKYGSTIDFVRELEVVLPEEGLKTVKAMTVEEALHSDATTRRVAELITDHIKEIDLERPKVTKNSCGYRLEHVVHDGIFDLPKLFVGSEGTLGIITRITFDTPRKPTARALLIVECSLEELDKVAAAFRELGPSAVELVDKTVFAQTGREDRLKTLSRTEQQYLVFCEFDGSGSSEIEGKLQEAIESSIKGFDPLTVTDRGTMANAWGARNEILTLATDLKKGTRTLLPGVEDLVVPPERLGDLVALLLDQFERRGLSYISYGHAGDANLHMRPFLDRDSTKDLGTLAEIMEECFESVKKMGGTMSGEHGDGMLRARFVKRQYPLTFDLMKQIRQAYDPKGLLSPGVKIA